MVLGTSSSERSCQACSFARERSMWSPMTRRMWSSLGLLSWLAPLSLHAQASGQACVDALPDSAFVRATAYLRPEVPDPIALAFRQPLYFLTESVAAELRRQLGGRGDSVPHGDQRIPWNDVGGRVPLVARRNATWNRAHLPDETHSGGGVALANAIDSVEAGREPFVWPDSVVGDSLPFALSFLVRFPNATGGFDPLKLNVDAFPVFTISTPRTSPVQAIRQVAPHYPEVALSQRVLANVMVGFVVDENGRVDPATVVADWPASLPRVGDLADDYYAFIAAVKASLASSTFAPRRVGGCAVLSVVHQPFVF